MLLFRHKLISLSLRKLWYSSTQVFIVFNILIGSIYLSSAEAGYEDPSNAQRSHQHSSTRFPKGQNIPGLYSSYSFSSGESLSADSPQLDYAPPSHFQGDVSDRRVGELHLTAFDQGAPQGSYPHDAPEYQPSYDESFQDAPREQYSQGGGYHGVPHRGHHHAQNHGGHHQDQLPKYAPQGFQDYAHDPQIELNDIQGPNNHPVVPSGHGGPQGKHYPAHAPEAQNYPVHAHQGEHYPSHAPKHHVAHKPLVHVVRNRPVVLKVSSLKTFSSKLPPGPPAFYAPSPDRNHNRRYQRQASVEHKRRHKRELDYNEYKKMKSHEALNRRKDSRIRGQVKKDLNNYDDFDLEDPLVSEGTEQSDYWDSTSPYLLFDTYQKRAENEARMDHVSRADLSDDYDRGDEEIVGRRNIGNRGGISFADSESDEQRFFPRFPSYLNPFGRGPLFPSANINRSPSRYNSHYGSSPNRGPSSPYSAESHEHYHDNNRLGSGNFAVVRGGTYYANGERYHSGGGGGYHHSIDDDDDYFYPYNSHSPPRGYRGGGDFLSNFRDFAEINPPSRSYSHNHEKYVHNDAPKLLSSASHHQPRNILDKIQTSKYSKSSIQVNDKDPLLATF